MASGAEIVGAAGAGASIIPALIGRGKSNYQAADISQSGMYDPFAYQFGNYGAENYAVGREQQAHAIDQRAAPQADYTQANQDRFNAAGAREGQQQAAQLMMDRATGRVPSVAMTQAAQDMQRAQAAQASMAASARGPAGVALAQQNRANNTANVMGRISNTSQINAMNERAQAEQAAFGANSAMRGQDYQGQSQAANQAQFQAGMQLGSRQANDARALGTQQMGHQAQMGEQQGRVQMQGIAAQSQANANAQNAQTDRQNAENKGLIDTIGDFFSDERTKYITSDFSAKQPFSLVAGGAMAPTSGAAEASADQLAAGGGGMDVLGSLQKHSDFATQYQRDPTGGMEAGMIMSDDRTKLKAAFEEGAKYADAAHAGVQIKPPDYAKAEKPRNPALGPKADDKTEMAHLARMEAIRGEQVSQPVPAVVGDPSRARLAPPQAVMAPARAVTRVAPPVAPSFGSDFTTKQPLKSGLTRDAYGNAAEGDENAPQFRYIPGQGWVNDAAPQRYSLEEMRDAGNEPDVGDKADQDARIAAMYSRESPDVADKPEDENASWTDQKTWASKNGKAAESKKLAPGTEDFEKTEPKEANGGPKPWWMMLQGAASGLNDAQFGRGVRSDRRAKNVIDLDEVDVDNDPGGQDFDADEHIESKFPKPGYERPEGRTTGTTKAERKRLQDEASSEADAMMAGFKANLGKGSAVDERVAASLKPSHSPVAEANRTMKGKPYVYKPEFTPPEQKPGEPNFGFMAQNLEKSPITATAVKEDPNGLKRVDALKLLRVLGASVADLQEQQDQTRLALAKGGRKK